MERLGLDDGLGAAAEQSVEVWVGAARGVVTWLAEGVRSVVQRVLDWGGTWTGCAECVWHVN